MAGGKRRSSDNKTNLRRPNRSSFSSPQSLFADGAGVPAGFGSPSFRATTSYPPGESSNSNSRGRSRNYDRTSRSDIKGGVRKSGGNAFRYEYPSVDARGGSQSDSDFQHKHGHDPASPSESIVFVGSKECKALVSEDQMPSKEGFMADYNFQDGSVFELDERVHLGLGSMEAVTPGSEGLSSREVREEHSHRGLGYFTEMEVDPSSAELSKQVTEEEQSHTGLGFYKEKELSLCITASTFTNMREHEEEEECSPDDEESEASANGVDEDDSEMVQKSDDENLSSAKNSAFLSIGGIRLYTEDISDEESDGEVDGESSDEGSSSDELSDADGDSDNSSDSVSDIDDEIVEDYVEGIGGTGEVLGSKRLGKLNTVSKTNEEEGDDSSDQNAKVLEKLGGISLQEASREYGLMKDPKSKKKVYFASNSPAGSTALWSSALDDLMLVKDPRRLSKKKKHVDNIHGSWPSSSRKSKNFRSYPGEKKKQRKEMIAVKRRERMMRRGVDLDEINLKLRDMVLRNVDILSFHPMHSRDCSQVRKLAAIYRLRSGCQGSGKKRFVIVTRTQHTSMPSSSDEIRLQKLLGAGKDDDADLPVVGTPNVSGSSTRSSKKSTSHHVDNEKPSRKKGTTIANQPVSFVSSGVMQSETMDSTIIVNPTFIGDSIDNNKNAVTSSSSAKFGAFESHTRGFGSKMMAKMGYVEGEGLGKDGQGLSEPIEVSKRPKCLGLGVEFLESRDGSESGQGSGSKSKDAIGARSARRKPSKIGEFERHTKGFGSKMMAKMGFVEGMGLGRDSQGIVNPIVAVRRPKARGIGAEI